MTEKKEAKKEIMVILLTEFREIFCGWTNDYNGEVVNLRDARQACYYSADTHGLLGLAVTGPAKGSKIGPAANIQCRKVVNIIECTSAAAEAWDAATWAR